MHLCSSVAKRKSGCDGQQRFSASSVRQGVETVICGAGSLTTQSLLRSGMHTASRRLRCKRRGLQHTVNKSRVRMQQSLL